MALRALKFPRLDICVALRAMPGVWPRMPTLSSAAQSPPGWTQVWPAPVAVPRLGLQQVLTSLPMSLSLSSTQ